MTFYRHKYAQLFLKDKFGDSTENLNVAFYSDCCNKCIMDNTNGYLYWKFILN